MGFFSDLFAEDESEKMLRAKREGHLDEYMDNKYQEDREELRLALIGKYGDDAFVNEVVELTGGNDANYDWLKVCISDSQCDKNYIRRVAGYYSEKKLDNADLNMNVPSGAPREIIKKILVAQFGIDVAFVDEAMKIMNDDASDSMLEETTSELIKGDYVTKGYALDIIYMFLGDFMK